MSSQEWFMIMMHDRCMNCAIAYTKSVFKKLSLTSLDIWIFRFFIYVIKFMVTKIIIL